MSSTASVTVGSKAIEALVGIFFIFATAAYWIFEREKAIGLVTSMMPRKHRKTVHDTWELIDAKLGAFVRGQLLLITFVATVLSLVVLGRSACRSGCCSGCSRGSSRSSR